MLQKFSGAGSAVAIVLFGFACSSTKDNATSDGGTGGTNVGTGGSGTGGSGGAQGGAGGSAGHAGSGGSTSTGGSVNHDAGSSGGSNTSDAGSTGGSNAVDSGSTGGAGGGGTVDSGPAIENALTNPGFEDGTMSPWTSNSSNFIVDGDSPRTGSFDGKLYSGFGDPTWSETMVQEGLFLAAGTYSFHIWVEKAGTGTLTTLRLEAESGGNTKTFDALSSVTNAYQEFSVTGVAVASPGGPGLGACTVRVVAAGDDHVSVYLDDASLVKAP